MINEGGATGSGEGAAGTAGTAGTAGASGSGARSRGRLRGAVRRLRPGRSGATGQADPEADPARAAQGEDAPDRAELVPHGLRVAGEWTWRLLLLAVAGLAIGYVLLKLSVVVVPVFIAILVTALLVPATGVISRAVPRGLAALLTLIALFIVIFGLLTLVGQQVAVGYQGLVKQVVSGVAEIQTWLVHGPLHLSQSEITRTFKNLGNTFSTKQVTAGALQVGTTVGHLVAGFFIALFSTYFFLYEGERIWTWLVRLLPRSGWERVDAAGRQGWVSLTAFVRATVLVALVDAIGITIVAVILRVPFALPIGVLVFLASFVPLVGAFVSGSVAVLVALVAQGPVVAALMLLGVLAVQQLEAHLLQPFLMGRFVRLHPLAILLAIAAGGYLFGIGGALFAVPLTAVTNGVVRSVAAGSRSQRARPSGPPPGGATGSPQGESPPAADGTPRASQPGGETTSRTAPPAADEPSPAQVPPPEATTSPPPGEESQGTGEEPAPPDEPRTDR
ncbi:Predicted PurR-regulated permease PerM [Actinopolymorpha cephalotaxi]|uniref:Predicted PurR-regulated permease PerM n=1 Tax=Actinopolymorpha cephalotaxi TaxID=504797 RepID=A0A1I2MB84_9ACTN|nr:Predicted PurR-regulated permease PerM [Actinopolymorpha cephalotaxi]